MIGRRSGTGARLLLLCAALFAGGARAAEMTARLPAYLGSETCIDCHEAQAALWEGSHHERAWMLPGPESMLGDFDGASFEHDGVTTRFDREDDGYYVETRARDGEAERYRIEGTGGVEPLQQYLVETEPGRLQALDVAWDAVRGRWYHLYPDQHLPPGDGLHWTGPYKNWNARCAECHATGYEKRYDATARRYDSREAEIGVGCEACHGPGEAHLAWAEDPQGHDAGGWRGVGASGFTIDFGGEQPEVEIQQCAGCHSRREAFLDGNPLPGTPYHDAYRLSLLSQGLYHPDGAILDEVYVYGSFLQSKMYARGVRCSDCHEPHSMELRAEGNAICTQCHSPAGNPDFPSLTRADYDDPSHHFHPNDSAGASCRSCHMVERTYMGIDGRRDHSFRVPRPDLSGETGAPNACTDCHTDRDAAWAAAELDRRFPDSAYRGPHFSQVLAAARLSPGPQADELVALAERDDLPGIVRATALDLLQGAADPVLAARAAAQLHDPDPLVRAAGAAVQRGAPPAERAERLAPLLRDPMRAVRIAAARGFLNLPPGAVPPEVAAALGPALDEWRASLLRKADFPETHLILGGAALSMRDVAAAEAAFGEAVRLDPQRADAWSLIVRILAATGDAAGAREALDAALASNPEDPALRELDAQVR
jgi:Tetratricopeptide repeat/Cytochrome c554 and c-prime/Doubled CXXCH motif (Paired_CXXCH_1)